MNSSKKQIATPGRTRFNRNLSIAKKILLLLTFTTCLFAGCDEGPWRPHGEGQPGHHGKNYPADVAVKWIGLQQLLIKTTPGFDPLVASRSFSFSGLTMYESIVKGLPGYRSVVSPRVGSDINKIPGNHRIYWPASANAAMAAILKSLFANTSVANKSKIDSLESVFNLQFQQEVKGEGLNESIAYGKTIASRIFEWSKTDGGHEAYLSATNGSYVPPTGPGMWIPTPPAFSQPIRPYWGDNRSMVPDIAVSTLPPPPSYSENPESEFYRAANEVYTLSQSLTADDISVVKTWGDLPGNYGTPAHYTNIATQLIQQKKFGLDDAVVTYARHGIALYEATICVFKAKYKYTLVRPVSFIRNVMGYSAWNTVIGTPAHPEYPSAHAVLGGASYVVLENIFGKNLSFTDRTHENLYGARTYPNLKAYAVEAAWSRVLGGIHYNPSAEIGLTQGQRVGALVNKIQFRTNGKY